MQESYLKPSGGDNTSRQPFNVVQRPRPFKLQPGNLCATIYYGLIFTAGMGLFAYVNSYFLFQLAKVVDGTNFSQVTQTKPNCNQFFCNQAMYNLLYYNTFYQQCNFATCQSTVCDNYNCADAKASAPNIQNYYGSLNAYYTCYPKCISQTNTNSSALMVGTPVPTIMVASYGVGITAAVLYGIIVLISIIVGFLMALIHKDLSISEKICLMLWVFCPGLKYYAIRCRTEWENFTLDTKALIICDLINAVLFGCVFAMYIFLASNGFWLSAVEVICFFFILANYIIYFNVLFRNARAMRILRQSIRQNSMVI